MAKPFSKTAPHSVAIGPKFLNGLPILAGLLGAAISLYLAVEHTRLNWGIQGGLRLCNLGEGWDCQSVQMSSWAAILGVSLGTIGWFYYCFLAFSLLFCPPGHRARARMRGWIARIVTLGLAYDFYLLGVQIFSLHNICIFCIGTYIANALILFGMLRETAHEDESGFGAAYKTLLFGKRAARFGPNILGAVAISLLAAWGVKALVFSLTGGDLATPSEPAVPLPEMKTIWKNSPTHAVPIAPQDATWGNPKANVQIVAFSDFECPFCRRAATLLHAAMEPYSDKVYFAFKHFPLDSSCNSELDRPMHPNACTLAHLGYCANAKGKFWEYHDKIFGTFTEKDLRAPVSELPAKLAGLFTPQEFQACLNDTHALGNTRKDVDMGKALKLTATPTIFVNGRQFTLPLTLENIRTVIEWELE